MCHHRRICTTVLYITSTVRGLPEIHLSIDGRLILWFIRRDRREPEEQSNIYKYLKHVSCRDEHAAKLQEGIAEDWRDLGRVWQSCDGDRDSAGKFSFSSARLNACVPFWYFPCCCVGRKFSSCLQKLYSNTEKVLALVFPVASSFFLSSQDILRGTNHEFAMNSMWLLVASFSWSARGCSIMFLSRC